MTVLAKALYAEYLGAALKIRQMRPQLLDQVALGSRKCDTISIMDLNLTPQELAFRDEVRNWLAANVPKDWEKHRLEDDMPQRFEFLRAWQKRVYEAGWAGISWPKEYGGRGATLMEQVIFTEEMARAGAPPLANVLGLMLIGPTIIAFGTDAQKKRFLPNILSADEIWCQGFSEPNAGSDLANVRTEAQLDGDHYVINGQKVWTSYGWAADWCALLTRSDPELHQAQGTHLHPGGHEKPGRRGSAAAADDRRERILRAVLPRRARAG